MDFEIVPFNKLVTQQNKKTKPFLDLQKKTKMICYNDLWLQITYNIC